MGYSPTSIAIIHGCIGFVNTFSIGVLLKPFARILLRQRTWYPAATRRADTSGWSTPSMVCKFSNLSGIASKKLFQHSLSGSEKTELARSHHSAGSSNFLMINSPTTREVASTGAARKIPSTPAKFAPANAPIRITTGGRFTLSPMTLGTMM